MIRTTTIWPLKRRRKQLLWLVAVTLLGVYLSVAVHHSIKPMPDGLAWTSPYRPATDVEFLADSSWLDTSGRQHHEGTIFDAALEMIGEAETLIVADFFLINEFAGAAADGHRPLSGELVQGLADRREQQPGLNAWLITDPFNTLYGGVTQPLFEQLRAAEVEVIETNLNALRDSNPAWSAAWRICCQWFHNGAESGWLPNPVGEAPVSLRTYLTLLNFKANHRKTLVTDGPDGWTGLVTSGNPHDASSRHHNVAIRFRGPSALDLLQTERAVTAFSAGPVIPVPDIAYAQRADNEGVELRILTEARIRDAALEMIDSAQSGERLDLLMFYLAHRGVVRALIGAQQRGVELRVLLDPNRDAFGREKNGIPNRQVAMELQQGGVPVRWCNTAGEQCHGKMLLHLDSEGAGTLLAGSANFTRRNLDNLNLETNVQVRAGRDAPVIADAAAFFDTRWHNEPDRIHSLPYSAFADHSGLRYWRYRFMEASGLSTF
jgi:phosphatidylserine/phosphatidylglycerophosphate/cardiolipin synthase-like enzyme